MDTFRFLLLFIPILITANMHEDAEDKKSSRWKLVTTNIYAHVDNLYDESKKSRIIEFHGEGTKHAYALKIKKQTKNEYWLSWQMKFSEDFVIVVLLKTNVGKRYLIYTPGTFRGHMQYGLGDASTNGKWQTIKRNLQKDLAYFDNRVKVISLKSFVVKGNGRIDNLLTQKTSLKHKTNFSKKYKQKKVLKKVLPIATNSLPVIKVEGADLMKLSLGEAYVEEGVWAYDKEDGDINVVSMENIDSNKVGRYMVLYMATDNDGNIALDKRYVEVGEVKEEIESPLKDTDVDAEELEEYLLGDEIDFSEAEKQIQIWEEELALREKELAQKENKSNKDKKRDES